MKETNKYIPPDILMSSHWEVAYIRFKKSQKRIDESNRPKTGSSPLR